MADHTLTGQSILITGAARRIGAELARGLHTAGANIVVHYRSSAEDANHLVDELNERRNRSAIAVAADLQDIKAAPGLIATAVGHFGRLDALINNASRFYPTPFGSVTDTEWEDLLGSNLRAPFFLAQAAADELRKHHGTIINMVDIHSKRPLADHSVYCIAKAGLAMLTKSLARELAPEVRVNGVSPGAILWPEAGLDDQTKQKIIGRTALKRTGGPEDIVNTVLFLLCDGSYMTGQIVTVDGGRSIGW